MSTQTFASGVCTDLLEGKIAIITGAARGMGAMHARQFVHQGAKVVIADLNEEGAKELAAELGEESALAFKLDVTSDKSWRECIAFTKEKFGLVNCLVNNAGVGIFKPLSELTEQDMELTFRVDEMGVFLGMKAVTEVMRENNGGSIVNISSVDGLVSAPTAIAYSAAKHAVTGMTKGAATELGQYGIRVNSVHPGIIKTDMAAQSDVAEFIKELEKDIPLRRSANAEEVSNVVVFLASDLSSYCSGAQFVVDGGLICDL